MSIGIGDIAPDFTLFSSQQASVELSSFKGEKNVLLLFFPGAFTSVCTTELNTVNNDLDAYGADTQILGISTDSPFAQEEFRKVNHLAFPLLSDHEATVCAAYGTKFNHDFTAMKLDRIARRSAFIVGKDGLIKYAEVLDSPGNQPDFSVIKTVLQNL